MGVCELCPRKCRVDRKTKLGFCSLSAAALVATVMLHKWEEPCICFKEGSGAVFFSGCQLQCVFCQNHEISCSPVGSEYSKDQLAMLFLTLEEKGACNVNLVSPTPHLETIIPALIKAKKSGLKIPVVFNNGGYERVETLKRLDGLVDVYLPDFKFFSTEISRRYANAQDYASIATSAIKEMLRQTGPARLDENEQLERGVIIRHLVLPGSSKDSIDALDHIFSAIPSSDVILSLMSQFIPMHKANQFPPLNRKITTLEYNRVVSHAKKYECKLVYTQEKESSDTSFVPVFSKPIDKIFSK